MGNRMSSLPIAIYCGQSARLGQIHGAGITALQSTCFHQRLANDNEWRQTYVRLPPEQQEELDSWPQPNFSEIVLGSTLGEPLDTEVEVAFDEALEATDAESGQPLSVGHIDMAWAPREYEGKSIAIINDAKRTRWTASLDSLQLDAYGWAWARLCGADGYLAGLYTLDEGKWLWRDTPVIIDSFEGIDIGQKLLAAARNTEIVTGPHCCNCWNAKVCPEHLVPVSKWLDSTSHHDIEGLLSAGTYGPEDIADLLEVRNACIEVAEKCITQAKAWVSENGPVNVGDGLVWGPTGGGKKKKKFDWRRFEADIKNKELVDEYTKTTTTSPQHRWHK